MSNIWNTILKKQDHAFEARNKPQPVEDVCGISINEFKKRNIGIEIYSEILNENIWFVLIKKWLIRFKMTIQELCVIQQTN